MASPVASGPSLETSASAGRRRRAPPPAPAAPASRARVPLEGPQAAAAAAAAEAASAQLRSLVQQAAQLRRDADGLAARCRRARAKTAAAAAAGADPAADAAWASGYVLWGARAPKDGERAGAGAARGAGARAVHAAAERGGRARRGGAAPPTLRRGGADRRRHAPRVARRRQPAAVERAEAHLLQLALPAPAAAAADGAALGAEAAKLPHRRGELVSLRPAARGRPAALALTLAPSAEPPFGADGVVIGRLLDGHDLLTQLCANRAAASGPPIEVKLDD